jgi:hypothetical protein
MAPHAARKVTRRLLSWPSNTRSDIATRATRSTVRPRVVNALPFGGGPLMRGGPGDSRASTGPRGKGGGVSWEGPRARAFMGCRPEKPSSPITTVSRGLKRDWRDAPGATATAVDSESCEWRADRPNGSSEPADVADP